MMMWGKREDEKILNVYDPKATSLLLKQETLKSLFVAGKVISDDFKIDVKVTSVTGFVWLI